MYLNFYYEVSIKCIVALAYQCVTPGFSPVVFSFLQLSLFFHIFSSTPLSLFTWYMSLR